MPNIPSKAVVCYDCLGITIKGVEMPIQTATDNPYRNVPRGKSDDPMQRGYFNYVPNEIWKPNVNLYETDSSYLVCVDLAGVDKNEIDVVVQDQHLRIRGRRIVPTPEDIAETQKTRLRVHLMEIDHGNFSREVELPANVEKDGISATHRNGMLWIDLPKKK